MPTYRLMVSLTYILLTFFCLLTDPFQVPYNQPGPALDMLTRFLKGESFHDRPLVTFDTMPKTDNKKTARASAATATATTNEMYQAALPLPQASSFFVGSSGMSGKYVVGLTLTVFGAVFLSFGMGFWMARHREVSSSDPMTSSGRRRCRGSSWKQQHQESYGSLSTRSRRGWTTAPVQAT